jgi:hydrogenase maturation protein HypF
MFHDTLAGLIVTMARRARDEHGTDTVVLAGGVFLNRKLLERTTARLTRGRFRVLRPALYSPNDESLSLGQIAYGLAKLKEAGT